MIKKSIYLYIFIIKIKESSKINSLFLIKNLFIKNLDFFFLRFYNYKFFFRMIPPENRALHWKSQNSNKT